MASFSCCSCASGRRVCWGPFRRAAPAGNSWTDAPIWWRRGGQIAQSFCRRERVCRSHRPEGSAALGIARTFQHGRIFANLSVEDNVLIGAHTRLRAVRPPLPLVGPLAELALALLRPAWVKG